MNVYYYDESRKLSAVEIIAEIEARNRPDVSGDVITVYGADSIYLDILKTCYGLGHRITCHDYDWFTMKLKDAPGAYPDPSIWKQLQLGKNRNCRIQDVSDCTFRHYFGVLPDHILFCATTRTYYDSEKKVYYREPESTVNRRKSLRSNGLAEYSAKQFRRYQRKYSPWAIENNDHMYTY